MQMTKLISKYSFKLSIVTILATAGFLIGVSMKSQAYLSSIEQNSLNIAINASNIREHYKDLSGLPENVKALQKDLTRLIDLHTNNNQPQL